MTTSNMMHVLPWTSTLTNAAPSDEAATDDDDGSETLSAQPVDGPAHRRRPRARRVGGERRRVLVLCAVVVVSVLLGVAVSYGVITLALRGRYATASTSTLQPKPEGRERRGRRQLMAGARRISRRAPSGGGGQPRDGRPHDGRPHDGRPHDGRPHDGQPHGSNMTCPDSEMIPPFDDMLWPHLYGVKLFGSSAVAAGSRRPLAFLKPPKCPKSSPSESRQCRAANARTLVAAVKTYGAGESLCCMLVTAGLSRRP